jgi:hypothetical protein
VGDYPNTQRGGSDVVKDLYQPQVVEEVKQRLTRLRPESNRVWGTMTPAQALAHCSASVQMALGEINPPRQLVGRLLGRVAKRSLIERGEPMRRNSLTSRELVVTGEPDFEAERQRLAALIDRFVAVGVAGCTRHPHLFFGELTPREWAALMYQHLDHHLRQFGV